MSYYEDDADTYELDLLAQEDATERRRHNQYLAHPDSQDPDHPFYEEDEE